MEYLSKNKIKWIRSLHQKKVSELENLFIVEGEKSVFEGLKHASSQLEIIVCTESFSHEIPNQFSNKLFLVHAKELEQVSSLKTPNKCLAVFKKKPYSISKVGLSLVLDGVQDPGNMGTILRLADWFGVTQLVCSEDTVDCYNSKVIQASMGAIYRIPVHYVNLDFFLMQSSLPKYGAMLSGENFRSVPYEKNALLIMGNEGNGVRPSIEKQITKAVTIPRIGEAESLNVATATAILLAEITK